MALALALAMAMAMALALAMAKVTKTERLNQAADAACWRAFIAHRGVKQTRQRAAVEARTKALKAELRGKK
jgi:hypothetical protein